MYQMDEDRNPGRVDAGYVLCGPRVEVGDVRVTLEEIEPLRLFVANDFFKALGKYATHIGETYDITTGGRRINQFGPYERDAPHIFVGASLRHDPDETWRMIVMRSSFCDARRDDKEYVRHFFEVIGGNIWIAKKETRTAQAANSSLEVDADYITDTVISRRRMYEKAIDPEDCRQLQTSLEHTVNYLKMINS